MKIKSQERASISIAKILCISLILILISGIGVMAVSAKLNDVKIVLRNGYEMTVLTSKTKVSDILAENNIILNEDESYDKKENNSEINDNPIFTLTIELEMKYMRKIYNILLLSKYIKKDIKNNNDTSPSPTFSVY